MKFQKIASIISLAVFALVIFSACDAFKPVTKQEYSKDDVKFTHLSNWQITEDSTTTESNMTARIITVEGPHDAVLTASKFPPSFPLTLEEYIKIVSEEMKKGAKDLTAGIDVLSLSAGKTMPSEARIAGSPQHGLAREFNIEALGTAVLHRAEYYAIDGDKEKWFIMMQSSKEDWESVKDGFQTMLDSFPAAAKTELQNAASEKAR